MIKREIGAIIDDGWEIVDYIEIIEEEYVALSSYNQYKGKTMYSITHLNRNISGYGESINDAKRNLFRHANYILEANKEFPNSVEGSIANTLDKNYLKKLSEKWKKTD